MTARLARRLYHLTEIGANLVVEAAQYMKPVLAKLLSPPGVVCRPRRVRVTVNFEHRRLSQRFVKKL